MWCTWFRFHCVEFPFSFTLPNKFVTWVIILCQPCSAWLADRTQAILTVLQTAGNVSPHTSLMSLSLPSENVTRSHYSPRQTFYKKGINWLGHFGRHFIKEDFYYFFHLHWRHSWGAKRGNDQRGDALLWARWWFVWEDNSAGETWSLHNRNTAVRCKLNSQ